MKLHVQVTLVFATVLKTPLYPGNVVCYTTCGSSPFVLYTIASLHAQSACPMLQHWYLINMSRVVDSHLAFAHKLAGNCYALVVFILSLTQSTSNVIPTFT
jgi:hypothetical protein